MIDPQLQATKWIKNTYTKDNLRVTKMNIDNLLKVLEQSIRMVQPLMIEDVDDSIDPAFDPILLKQYNIVNGRKLVKIGD